MARFVAGAVFGAALMLVGGAAVGLHAQDAKSDVESAAAQAGVDPVDLQGALNSTGIGDARAYLRMTGELPPLPVPKPVASSARAACIIQHESQNNPNAVNPRTHASGLGQFLSSTWLTTPQGRAGLSVFDPVANRSAVQWMLDVGRGREFSTFGLC